MTDVERAGRVSVVDVAERAGVSTATAARALGGYGSVSPATLTRVQDAAVEIGYLPNNLARSMITGQTRAIGVVLADMETSFFHGVLRGITDRGRSRGFDVLLANTDENAEHERTAMDALYERRAEGIIVCPVAAQDDAWFRPLANRAVPVVVVDRPVPGLAVDTVGLDNRRAAREATTHLLDLGHRHIGVLTGGAAVNAEGLRQPGTQGLERLLSSTLGLRTAGYRDALLAAGIAPRPEFLTAGGSQRDDARDSVHELMALTAPPTALFAFNSVLALGAVLGLRSLGLRCPEDVSLIGFDDAEWAEALSPPLSVVRQPVHQIGTTACELLLRRIADRDASYAHRRLRGTFVRRGSTAPPPTT